MNNQIIPRGPQETITNGSIAKNILCIFAETDLVITALVYISQATPAHANVDNAFTLTAGRFLSHVKSLTFTGTATVIYTGN